MLGGEILCETENLDLMPQKIFLLEPIRRLSSEQGLLCLSVLWVSGSGVAFAIGFKDFNILFMLNCG